MLGDCDVVVAELCRRAGWTLEHEMVPRGQRVEVELQEGFASRYVFRVVDGAGEGIEKEKADGKGKDNGVKDGECE